MTVTEDHPGQFYEAAPQDEALLARSIAPTLHDIRVENSDLLETIVAEPEAPTL